MSNSKKSSKSNSRYRIESLTAKEQNFIYEVSRKFITGATMDEIAKSIGISRRTAFNWKDKYKELILEQKVQEFSTIEDKVLKTANDLLDSNKLGDRLKGSDLYFKTVEILEKRADKKHENKPVEDAETILKSLGL